MFNRQSPGALSFFSARSQIKALYTVSFIYSVLSLLNRSLAKDLYFQDELGVNQYQYTSTNQYDRIVKSPFAEISDQIEDGLCGANIVNSSMSLESTYRQIGEWRGDEQHDYAVFSRADEAPGNSTIESCLRELLDAANEAYIADLQQSTNSRSFFSAYSGITIGLTAVLLMAVVANCVLDFRGLFSCQRDAGERPINDMEQGTPREMIIESSQHSDSVSAKESDILELPHVSESPSQSSEMESEDSTSSSSLRL